MTTHSGLTPTGCPACKADLATAIRFRDGKVRKVYGRVSANARREHANNQRFARSEFDRLFREHHAAVREGR